MAKTSDFVYFSSPSEANDLVDSALKEHKDLLRFMNSNGNEYDIFSKGNFFRQERIFWATLSSKYSINNDGYLNAIQFILPERSDSGLLMGAVAIKYDENGTKQFRIYNSIKKKIIGSLKSGVFAINRTDGASRFYRDIYYSDYADNISREGVELLTRYGDGNVYYSIEL